LAVVHSAALLVLQEGGQQGGTEHLAAPEEHVAETYRK
jgi:hypothetical protein